MQFLYRVLRLLLRKFNFIGLLLFKIIYQKKVKFECPICHYHGAFFDYKLADQIMEDEICPKCFSQGRHRLQYLVVQELFKKYDFSKMTILHFAPEEFFRNYFSRLFIKYTTADLYMENVDIKADLTNLPFKDNEYDVIFASHVLEHIKNDLKALSEIKRVLKPGGIAILPVPIVANNTIEYSKPNPDEHYHVRAPGLDYFKKYKSFFKSIKKYSSQDFPEQYHVFIKEDRTIFPNKNAPDRPPMEGDIHNDYVPVCIT